MKQRTLSRLLAATALAAVLLPAQAALSRDQAAAAAQRETGGRVLSVDRSDSGGRSVWRVKVVTQNGEVRVLMFDAGK